MKMRDKLGQWYRLGKIAADSETLTKRFEAIDTLMTKEKQELLYYIRIFNQNNKVNQEKIDEFISPFLKTDPAFKSEENNIELSILAGATLLNYLDQNNSFSDIIALSVVCSDLCGEAPQPPVPEMKQFFINYLNEKANLIRKREPQLIDDMKFKLAIPKEKQKLDEAFGNNQIPSLKDPLLSCFDALCNNTNKLFALHTKAIHSMEDIIRFQKEETNILWWLIGEYCNGLSKAMKELTIQNACIAIGCDLANLVAEAPGPLASEAFIRKMLISCKGPKINRVTIKEVIEATDLSWITKYFSNRSIEYEDFMPISLALNRYREAGGSGEWLKPFSEITKINALHEIDPVLLSLQFCNESLLNKLIKSGVGEFFIPRLPL